MRSPDYRRIEDVIADLFKKDAGIKEINEFLGNILDYAVSRNHSIVAKHYSIKEARKLAKKYKIDILDQRKKNDKLVQREDMKELRRAKNKTLNLGWL